MGELVVRAGLSVLGEGQAWAAFGALPEEQRAQLLQRCDVLARDISELLHLHRETLPLEQRGGSTVDGENESTLTQALHELFQRHAEASRKRKRAPGGERPCGASSVL